MIPDSAILTNEILETTYSSRTYNIDVTVEPYHRINGFIDDIRSVQQSIYLRLNTEKYKYIIYSWDYGIELIDLIGKPLPYVMSEVPRRIEEALLQDNRIKKVHDFQFEKYKNKLKVTFTVTSDVGDYTTTLEVSV